MTVEKARPLIKTKKFKGLENGGLKCKKKKTPPYPKKLFPLHTMSFLVGNIGSGKTYAINRLYTGYQTMGPKPSFTRLFIISPTYEYNEPLKQLGADDEDIYTDRSRAQESIVDITKKVQEMADEYEAEKLYKKTYEKWSKNGMVGLKIIEIQMLHEREFKKPMKHIPFPSPCLIIDDMSHTSLYASGTKNPFVNLVLRHRHLHGLGISIFMLVQTFKTGAQKALRQNGRQFIIFPTHDYTQLKGMYEDLASRVSYDDFVAIYEHAIDGNKHNFLCIDMVAKDDNKLFRRNFDEFVYTEGSGSSLCEADVKDNGSAGKPTCKKNDQKESKGLDIPTATLRKLTKKKKVRHDNNELVNLVHEMFDPQS